MSRDRDVDSFDRRAGSYERDWRAGFHQMVVARSAEVAVDAAADPRDLFATGWLRPIAALGRRRDRMRTAQELESMLATARLRPLAWQRIYDLGRLPLVQAVTSEVAGPAAGR
jgi:hypothetical protein